MNTVDDLKVRLGEVSRELERLTAEKVDLEKQIKTVEEQETKALLDGGVSPNPIFFRGDVPA